jgi:hypothetical protein
MGAKKKAAAAAKAGGGDEEDVTFHNFFKYYKRNCQIAGIESNKRMRNFYEIDYLVDFKDMTNVSLPFYSICL